MSESTNGELRLGIAGCGRIVERGYIPAALATPGVRIVALADPDADRLRHCHQLWRRQAGEALAFADAAEMLRAEAIDLLVVAAPAAAHAPLAEEAAAAGIRALVEKPPAADMEGARRLLALRPEPYVAFNRRFLQGEEIGSAVPAERWLEFDLELRFRRDAWGAHEARDEALLDAGIHLIDLACHLSGATPIAVRRAVVEPERACLELELARGRARIRCATDRRHREAVAVRDRTGKLIARSVWGGVRGRLAAAAGNPDPLALSLRRQLEALGDQEGTGASRLASAHDGATAIAVVEAARRSAALDGAEVTVALPVGAAA
jgi:predicted dehydrogenase